MDSLLDTEQDSSGDPPGGGVGLRRKKQSARERVYEILRDELMGTSFSPYKRLTEESVAARFGVSRTPVRDALARLQTDGLLIKRDGALFRYIPTLPEFTELYELRLALERRGIERAIEDPTITHNRAALEQELAIWHARRDAGVEPSAGFVTADEQFHVALLGSAGNREITKTLLTVNQRIRPVRMHDYLTEDRVAATISEHIEIAELVLRNKLIEARDSLRFHVGESQAVVEARALRAMHMTQIAHEAEDGTG